MSIICPRLQSTCELMSYTDQSTLHDVTDSLPNQLSSDLCTFCNEECETLYHLIISCKYSQTYWYSLNLWFIKHGYSDQNQLDSVSIILGIKHADIIINHIILIAKYVIYRCKLNKRKPTLDILKAYLKQTMHIEKYIAYSNQKIDTFLGKWSPFLTSLTH